MNYKTLETREKERVKKAETALVAKALRYHSSGHDCWDSKAWDELLDSQKTLWIERAHEVTEALEKSHLHITFVQRVEERMGPKETYLFRNLQIIDEAVRSALDTEDLDKIRQDLSLILFEVDKLTKEIDGIDGK